MKLLIAMCSLGLLLAPSGKAEEPAAARKVSLTVRKQVLDSDHDLRGGKGSSGHKTLTLHVEITNTTQSPLPASELEGTALVKRAVGERETIVRESLGTLKLPPMKPNEKLSLDLGRIRLSEVEWRNRRFEESLEEWKVVCRQQQTEIGKAVSSDHYEPLEKELEAAAKPANAPGPQRGRIRRIGD